MKFSATALVLATLAVESASAASIRHAHRHAHSKKEAKPVDKRVDWTPPPGYDPHWTPPAGYNPYATTADSAQPTAAAPESSAPAPSSAAPAKSSPSPASNSNDDSSNLVSDVVTSGKSIMSNVANFLVSSAINVAGKNVLAGANPTSANDFVWLGEDAAWTNTLTNNADADITLVVFKKSDGSSQWVDQHQPAVTVKIPQSKSVTLSMADGASGAFVAIYPDTKWTGVGLLQNVIGEFTAANFGTFDVSKEWANSTGHGMTIDTGNGCKSSTDGDCVFQCKTYDGGDYCGTAGSYELAVGSMGSKCNKAQIQDQGKSVDTGGCTLYDGDDTKAIKTSFF